MARILPVPTIRVMFVLEIGSGQGHVLSIGSAVLDGIGLCMGTNSFCFCLS